MPYEIKHFDDAPIVLETMPVNFSIKDDLNESIHQIQDILDAADVSHFFIIDATETKVNFGDAISGMAIVTRGDTAIFRHPKLRELLIVTKSNPITELTAKAFSQQQYGNLKVKIFPDVDKAVEYARTTAAG